MDGPADVPTLAAWLAAPTVGDCAVPAGALLELLLQAASNNVAPAASANDWVHLFNFGPSPRSHLWTHLTTSVFRHAYTTVTPRRRLMICV